MKITKILSAILACQMILSAASFTALAEERSEVVEKSALDEAINRLETLGISKGITEDDFGEELNVSREQMAAFIYRFVNKGASLEDAENTTSFSDLKDPTFFGMIAWANNEGIIKGMSDTVFNPAGGITLQDCYTMVVRMFGYEDKKSLLGYPEGYITVAEQIGLSQDINKEAYTDELTRGDVAIILNNALNKKSHVLDGKRILFIGNSYTYYGNMVGTLWYSVDEDVIPRRFNDTGAFYQLCRQNGANVTVTNWAWSGHNLTDMFSGNCQNKNRHPGYDHLADLKKYDQMYYDYVVIQPSSSVTNIDTLKGNIKFICETFKEVNPNVEFVYNICDRYYRRANDADKAYTNEIENIATEYNLKIANWGKLVADILSGEAVVENSTEEYTNNTFLVSNSATDGYHPNLLTGYISTQTIYSVLTGESAVGEDCSFCTDASLCADDSWGNFFDLEYYLSSYYKYDNISDPESEVKLTGDDLTNFPEILASKTEMEGIQKLIDKYVKAYN